MKQSMKKLIKDIILIAVLGGFAALMLATDSTMGDGGRTFFTLAIMGLPFGWRWASKIITAVSLKGIGLKILISACLGCVAIFVVVGIDALKCIFELIGSRKVRNEAF